MSENKETSTLSQNNENSNPNKDDKPTIGLSILSFFIPLVGFILAAANWKSKPISAKRYLIISGISFALFIFLNIVTPDEQSTSNTGRISNSNSNTKLNAKSAETYDKNPFEAVIACDVEAMKSLLAKNPALVSARYKDYSQYKSNESTLLHYAVSCRNEMTKTLIDAGADVNAKDRLGLTPLMVAVSDTCDRKRGICPNPETTKILIDAGADVNAQGSLNTTPLIMAIHSSTNIDCVKLLIAAGANVKEHFEGGYKSPLYRAVEEENPGLVRLLISSGAYYDEKALDYIRKEIYNKRNKGETPSSDMLLIRDILEDAQRR